MINWKNELNTIISNIGSTFKDDELAFLAVTSKIELPLRDKIAFELQNKYSNKIICREWTNSQTGKRTDLAILNNEGEVECVIEFKAHSDMINIRQYVASMKNDIEKSLLIPNNPEVYFVIFINYISQLPTVEHLDNAIKYNKSIQKAIDLSYDRDKIINDWNDALNDNNIENKYDEVEIEGGKYFNSDVSVISLIHGPLKDDYNSQSISKEKLSVEENEIDTEAESGRKRWVDKTSEETVKIIDDIFDKLKEIIGGSQLNYYRTTYIPVIVENDNAPNLISFRPRPNGLFNIAIRRPETTQNDIIINELDTVKIIRDTTHYHLTFDEGFDINSNIKVLRILLKKAKD